MDGRGRGARDGSPRHSPRCCAGASTRTRSTPARPRSASAPRRAAWMPQPAAGASRPSKSGSHLQGHVCVYVCLSFGAPLTPLPLRVYTRATPGYALPRQRSHAAIATPQGPARQPVALSTLGCTRKIQLQTEAHSGSPHSHTNTHTHAQRTALHVRDRNPTAEGTTWVAHEGLQPLDPLCEELLHSATRYEAAPARRRCSSSQALDPRLPRGTREPFGSETLHH